MADEPRTDVALAARDSGAASPFLRPLPGFSEPPSVLGEDAAVARGAVSLRDGVEDFVVEEVPAYLPAGQGEHLYLWIEKRGVSTPELLTRLRRTLQVSEREIGIAGMKDARGVTRQWVSVPVRAARAVLGPDPDASSGAFDSEGVRVLQAAPHGNKLRLGHSRGNRFLITLRGDLDVDRLSARAARAAEGGVPNRFGAQRFGRGDRGLRDAEAFVHNRRFAKSRRERFYVSAVQSALFNAWLDDRVRDGSWNSALDGDVMMKRDTGAPFDCTDPVVDAERCRQGLIGPSGPLLGARMRSAARDALTRESRSWEVLGVDAAAVAAHPAFDSGARRAAVLHASGVEVAAVEGGARVSFSLPPGAYASVFLREVVGAALVDPAAVDVPDGGSAP